MNETIRELGTNEGREEFTLTAAALPGDVVFLGDGTAAICMHSHNAVAGETVPVATDIVLSMDSASGTLFARGAGVAWNPTTKLAVPEGTAGSRPIGLAAAAKTNGQTAVTVRLNGQRPTGESAVLALDRTFTTAQVNAVGGSELLPAIPGFAYKVRQFKMISIGGNAAGATTVDILGTQSAASVKLAAVPVAGLTTITPVRDASGNVLAAGASYARCDANTPLLVSVTGSALSGTTSLLVIVDYQLVAV